MNVVLSILLGAVLLFVVWLVCHLVGYGVTRGTRVLDPDGIPAPYSFLGFFTIIIVMACAAFLYVIGSPLLQVLEHGWFK